MKFICQTKALKDALHLLKIESETPREIAMHTLKEKLQLKYYDVDERILIQYTIPAEVRAPGTAMTLAEPLEQILEHAHVDALSFSFHEWHVRLDIEGEKHRHSLSSRAGRSPGLELLAESDATWYRFDASHFCQNLKRVLFAVPAEKERPERLLLSGVLFHRHEGKDRMVATDGRRLAVCTLASSGQPKDEEETLPNRAMPYSACVKFIDMIESLEAERCRLRFGEEHLSFECEGVSLRCPWPKGDFPDYLAILPAPKPPLRVQVNREMLIWALELVYASQRGTDHRTEFRVESGQMTLEHNHPEIGQAQVQIPVQYEGATISAFFDVRFIKEALFQTDTTEVTFCFHPLEERIQPMILELGDGFDYLVMPMIEPFTMSMR